jgi:hypothetical protein
MFNNLNTHLTKLQLCSGKCKKFDINLNPKKCMFLMHSHIILGHVISKEGKLLHLKKILAIVHMPTLKTLKDIHVFNGITQYYQCFIKDFVVIMVPITKLLQRQKLSSGQQNANKLGKKSSSVMWMHRSWFHFTGTSNFMFIQTPLIL